MAPTNQLSYLCGCQGGEIMRASSVIGDKTLNRRVSEHNTTVDIEPVSILSWLNGRACFSLSCLS